MEFYDEIYGGAPIFDVYDDDDDQVVHDYDLEVCLRKVKNEFQNFKLGMAEIIRSFEKSVNRLLEAAIRNRSARGRARGGNAQRSERSNATSHHTSRTKKRHRPVRAKKTPQTEKKKKTSQTKRTMTKGATKTTKKFTPTGRGIKKLHRHHVRTIVLCEIRNYKRSTKLLICKLSFQRLVHDRGRHGIFPHVSNKKLLEFGVGGFTHKSMNFGDKVLLDGGVMMRYYLRKKMTWPRVLVILISSGMCFFAHVLSG